VWVLAGCARFEGCVFSGLVRVLSSRVLVGGCVSGCVGVVGFDVLFFYFSYVLIYYFSYVLIYYFIGVLVFWLSWVGLKGHLAVCESPCLRVGWCGGFLGCE